MIGRLLKLTLPILALALLVAIAPAALATVNYGDGGGTIPLAVDQINQEVTLGLAYTAGGTYTVAVTIEDDDSGSHTDSFEVNVNSPAIQYTTATYQDGEGAGTSNVVTLTRNTSVG